MKIRLVFQPKIWMVGAFWYTKWKRLSIFPLPCCGIVLDFA